MIAVSVLTLATLSLSWGSQSRDVAVTAAGSFGRISGTVYADESPARPLPRVSVNIRSLEGVEGGTVITDDAGRFVLDGLSPGRYSVVAYRPGYVRMAHGARFPTRPGTPVTVANGQPVIGISIKMPRGAVITGVVTNSRGEPMPGAEVSVLRNQVINGDRTLVSMDARAESTDDQGIYRVYGLPPGEYLVVASVPRSFSSLGELREVTLARLQAAKQALNQLQVNPSKPTPAQMGLGPSSDSTDRTVSFAPVYYGGTTVAADATPVRVATGEERAGVDIALQYVPTARISGWLERFDGGSVHGAQVLVVPQGGRVGPGALKRPTLDVDGRFELAGLVPGTYSISARLPVPTSDSGEGSLNRSIAGATPQQVNNLWAVGEIRIDGRDLSDLRLVLRPGTTLSGRVRFEGAVLPGPSRFRINVRPVRDGDSVSFTVPSVAVQGDGEFYVRGIPPGRYTVTANAIEEAGVDRSVPWTLKDVTASGRSLVDEPFEVTIQERLSNIVVTFTDRPTELSGTLQDASGRAAPDYFIIVFPVNAAHWSADSRRIVSLRPASDGRFFTRGLPPGEYFVAALTDVEQGEWLDREFLKQVMPDAFRVTLTEGQFTRQDFRIR